MPVFDKTGRMIQIPRGHQLILHFDEKTGKTTSEMIDVMGYGKQEPPKPAEPSGEEPIAQAKELTPEQRQKKAQKNKARKEKAKAKKAAAKKDSVA